MCGIFGIILSENSVLPPKFIKNSVTSLFTLSESRGKEASGIVLRAGSKIIVLKEPIPASQLIKSTIFSDIFRNYITLSAASEGTLVKPLVILGHSRLVTSGKSELNANNQPVIKDGVVGIHNGVIVNDARLWQTNPSIKKECDLDSEVLVSLLKMYQRQGQTLIQSIQSTYTVIDGSASVAVLFDDNNSLLLATNTGSLYYCRSEKNGALIFASEKHILTRFITSRSARQFFTTDTITQLRAGEGVLISLQNLEMNAFDLKIAQSPIISKSIPLNEKIEIIDISPPALSKETGTDPRFHIRPEVREEMLQNVEQIFSGKVQLKRCTRCVLPETMPYIFFDDEGVCNYCRNFETRDTRLKGEQALREFVEQYRSPSGEPDCIVGFSGGRDSTYGLDYIKNTLNLHPIAFTYEWAMVNDLARRNQARVVSRLGVEQIIVSADIKKKREYIRKNLTAWLRKPDLGMVPLLMAGDKEFYYYFHEIRKQTGVKLFVFSGGHEIEETPFKYGFCGVDHGVNTVMNCLTGISLVHKLKMLLYFAKQYITNPGYINSSIFDTFFAYYCTYFLKDDYLYLYHFIEWDEKTIISTIRKKFDWELAHDTSATWRTDDGTAAFYNYIYLTMAGFTEFDNFRSYQVREGKITRDEAMVIIKEENQPRFEAIEWYAEAVGIDINEAIGVINAAPKLYKIPRE
jgi:glucosamine--fructose-6-phosphate aminotransferase (isomerizing)